MAKAPSWLQINEENFKDLLDYLQENVKNKDTDPFFAAACELLDGRVKRIIPILAEDLDAEKCIIRFRIRLLGAWLLCYPDQVGQRNQVFLGLLACISQITSDMYSQDLFSVAVKALSYEIMKLGFVWDDLTALNEAILRHKIVNGAVFGELIDENLWYAGKGLLHVSGKHISLIPLNMKRWNLNSSSMVESMKICEERLSVWTQKDERLKQSESSVVTKIDAFTTEFRRNQRTVIPTKQSLKQYTDGQTVPVKVTYISTATIRVETADPNYEKITGNINKGNGWYFYSERDLASVIKEGDYLNAEITSTEQGVFSISKQFLDAILNEVSEGSAYPCEYCLNSKSGPLWMTNTGVPLYVKDSGSYDIRDRAFIHVTKVGSNGYIQGEIDANQSEIEDQDFDDYKGWFIENKLLIEYTAPQKQECKTIGKDVVRIFERMLYNYQKSLSRASEIYKVLCFCQMLAELTEDERELHYLELKASYLEQLVLFTKGQYSEMKDLIPSYDIAQERSIIRCVNIVRVLKEINTSGDDSQLLSEIILSEKDALVIKLARILQSYNRIKEIVPEKTLLDLKQEMIKELSLDSEIQSSLDEDEEENLGMEDKTKEFKSSFIFPADKSQHMSANMKKQSRNVFKGICAFLNSMIGGTLYLGVDDRGYVIGLENDLDQIKGSIDSYIRLIQDEAKQAFEQSILEFLDFEVMCEGRVVAIKVRPYPDGLVYMEKVPYKRNFGESEPMREDEKARMISMKLSSGKADSGKLGTIDKAIVEKKCLCLKRYSSASGIRDRHVEPFKVTGQGKFVWCYDLVDKQCKQYSISRAADILLLNETWRHQMEHKALETDIFNWSGDKAMHIELRMDNLACNILKDEYPLSAKFLTSINDGEEWILSTDVYRCEAPGRFIIGLLDHVKILQGEELKKYVQDYITNHFDAENKIIICC